MSDPSPSTYHASDGAAYGRFIGRWTDALRARAKAPGAGVDCNGNRRNERMSAALLQLKQCSTMIESPMPVFKLFDDEEFWSDEYRGRPIAILNRHGRLHVYLDHVLQQDIVFDRGRDALAWLIQRIEQGVPARVN